jgi:hypothetical protein
VKKDKKLNTLFVEDNWSQEYIAYFRDVGEIPLNAKDEPNPSEWSRISKATKNVKDWIEYNVLGGKLMRYFSLSTKTFYDMPNRYYREPIVNVEIKVNEES